MELKFGNIHLYLLTRIVLIEPNGIEMLLKMSLTSEITSINRTQWN